MADAPSTTITPSILNTPKNGATTQTQQPSEPKPATAAPPAADDREAKLAAREAAIEKRERVYRDELNKYKTDNKGLGAKLSRLSELEKWRNEREQKDQLRKLNPIEALKEDFGENYREKLTELFVTGVPPTDMIAGVVQQMRAEFKAELEARDAKTREQTTLAEQGEVEEARAMVAHKSARWFEANAKEYPVFARLGDADRVGQILGQRIEQYFKAKGQMLTEQQAADMLENEMLGFAEDAMKADKYKSKLQGETKPANVSPSSGSPSRADAPGSTRRTLDNSMTASTSGRAPPRSDAERFARATEAFNAARSKGT